MRNSTDLRIIKTEKALYTTFLNMLEKQSFDSITINDLCEQAMVRRATFYKHYIDKYDFFAHFVRYIREEDIGKMRERLSDDSLQSYGMFLLNLFIDFSKQHHVLIQNMLKSNMLFTILDIFSEETCRYILEFLKDEKIDLKGVSLDVLASFYTGGIIQVLRMWLTDPNTVTEQQVRESISTLLEAFSFGKDILDEGEKVIADR